MQKMNLKTLPTLTIKLVAGLLLVTMLLAGCNSPAPTTEAAPVVEVKPTEPPPPTAVPTAVPTEEPTPVPTPEKPGVNLDTPEHQAFLAAWEASPHGNTYDLGKGPNTYCSRCHSPQNWDPASTTAPPPNCVTCKFPTDAELRIASTMDFVSEEDWVGIGCDTCHATEDGRVLSEVSWLNVITMEREPVAITNELCGKCHVDSAGVKASGGRGVTHGISLGGSAHLNWAGALPQGHRPSYCSDCHDPHSLAPKQCVECHEAVLTLETHMKGTADSHQNLDCMACHDASGSDVAPFPADSETPYWTTVLTETSRSGATTTSYVKSHSIMWEVDCSRCHYAENPWALEVYTADGSVPETTGN